MDCKYTLKWFNIQDLRLKLAPLMLPPSKLYDVIPPKGGSCRRLGNQFTEACASANLRIGFAERREDKPLSLEILPFG